MAGKSWDNDRVPQVWLLASPHQGDNTQLLALAEALGWPFAIKRRSNACRMTRIRRGRTCGAKFAACSRGPRRPKPLRRRG